jgi:hypothetical protein
MLTVTGVPARCMNRSQRLVGLLAARRPEPAMTVARSVADVLDDHVAFEVESIDRMYLNVWQPRLAYGGGVQGFFVGHRGYHYASTALMDPMTKAFVADIHGFVAARGWNWCLIGLKDGVGDVERRTRTYARLGDRLIYIGGLPTAETFALPLLELGVSTYSSALYNFLPEFALSFFDAVRARDRGACTAGSTTSSCPTPISATGPRATRSRSSRRA